jgi:septum site-determining protein MinC
MSNSKENVTIKGTKDGFNFMLNSACSFDAVLDELQHKLNHSHGKILSGPIVHVHIKTGERRLTDDQKHKLLAAIRQKGNLLVQSIQSNEPAEQSAEGFHYSDVVVGMVRSGQVLEHEGHLLLLGDVNPGGTIRCSGNIYVMGMLRGTAHAGMYGDTKAVITASYMKPTQLRIAGVISRPPEEWESDDHRMEVAYLQGETISIEKVTQMHRVQDIMNRWGEKLWEKQS